MKVVAVSQRVDFVRSINEIRDSLDQRLMSFVTKANMMPILVPNSLVVVHRESVDYELLNNWLYKFKPEGIILSGGNNIGEEVSRDYTELRLINYALENSLPLLGICRGMQMIANFENVGLKPVSHHINTRHFLFGEINREVNSYHRYALCKCPVGYKVIGFSEDNEIEAIKHNNRKWEAWMWHPEREAISSSEDLIRISRLFFD